MNLIILGPMGSGKGTQAELLVKKFGFNYVEMGQILRNIAASDNPKADQIRDYQNRGELVPDEFTRLIAWDHINKNDKSKGFIFDGYPRSLPQYEHLVDMLKKFGQRIDRVIFIKISETEIVRRLSARRRCEHCKEIFNLVTKPPKDPTKCDNCGRRLEQRDDDRPEAILVRLADFQKKTVPVLEKAKKDGVLLEIDGERPIEVIHQDIVQKLGLA